MARTREEITQEIIKLKTENVITLETKTKIQKLQQELGELEDEKKNTKNL